MCTAQQEEVNGDEDSIKSLFSYLLNSTMGRPIKRRETKKKL
jgi:hypothetical protein